VKRVQSQRASKSAARTRQSRPRDFRSGRSAARRQSCHRCRRHRISVAAVREATSNRRSRRP
jgi:hypothetical protein